MNQPTFQLQLTHPKAKIQRATPLSAGYDLFAAIDEPVTVLAGSAPVLVSTGIKACSFRGDVAAIILPRSGLGHKKGLVLGNTLGLIDGDYQGVWYASAYLRPGNLPEFVINPGDPLCQCIFVPVLHPIMQEVTEFVATDRGEGGFGSTMQGAV